MATYTGKTVAELRLLCQAKKLSCSKLKKAELSQLLLDNECVGVVAADDSSGDGVSNSVDGDDEVIEDDGDDDEVVLPVPGVSEPSSDVARLKLQIKLSELTSATHIRLAELEFEKMKLSANSSATSISSTVSGGKPKVEQSVKGLLPQMGGNGDCLNCSHVFERTLEMHDVPRQQWSYYLPSCLNSRAMKV